MESAPEKGQSSLSTSILFFHHHKQIRGFGIDACMKEQLDYA